MLRDVYRSLAGWVGLGLAAACSPPAGPSAPPPTVTSVEAAPPPNCVDLTNVQDAELQLAQLPEQISVRATQCPAVHAGETSGRVDLGLTVECNGLVSDVEILEGIGHGCDELAADAVRSGRFRAAKTTAGTNARVKIRYVVAYAPNGSPAAQPSASSPAPAEMPSRPPSDPPVESPPSDPPVESPPAEAPAVEAPAVEAPPPGPPP